MKSHTATGTKQLAVDSGQDAHHIVGASCRAHDTCRLINGLQELTDHKRYRLNTLDFFLSTNKFAFQVALLIFHVLFHCGEELELLLQLLVVIVHILWL